MVANSVRQGTTAALSALGDDWCVLTGVGWPARADASIDHVVVGPGGVFVIESRHLSGQLEMREDGLRHHGRLRNDVTSTATFAALAVSDVLDLDVCTVHPVLCLVHEDDLSGWAGDVFVTTPQELADELATCPLVLGPDEVARILALAATELPAPAPQPPDTDSAPDRPAPAREPVPRTLLGADAAPEQKLKSGTSGWRRTRVGGPVVLMLVAVSAAGMVAMSNFGGAAATRAQATGELGDTIDIVGASSRPDLRLRAAKVQRANGAGRAVRPGKGLRFVAVRFEIDNVGDQKYTARGLTPAVVDQAGTTYGPADRASHLSQVSHGQLLAHLGDLRPGRSVRGWVVFEVPRRVDIETVTLSVAAGAQTAIWHAPQGS